MFIPAVPLPIRRRLRALGCRKTEWEMYEDSKWFGYTTFGGRRVAITIALVTGKAVVEILAPVTNEDIIL